jgi:hypothetical protein
MDTYMDMDTYRDKETDIWTYDTGHGHEPRTWTWIWTLQSMIKCMVTSNASVTELPVLTF